MRLGELCAGYGGLGMAVEEVFGATTAWFSEYDAAPSKILAHHWPDVPNYGDMTKIDWAEIEHVDIISGGTPCQDLSAAGRRAGMTEGTRSNLWVQMREAIAIQKPAYVVWENVRGAYSATAASDLEQCPGCMGDTTDGGTVLRALGRVLGDLSDLGFDTEWRGLRAADVGACHGRFRVFVFAAHPERVHSKRRGIHEDLARKTRKSETDSRKRKRHGDAADHRQPIDWGHHQPAIARWEAAVGRHAPAPTEPTPQAGGRGLSPRFAEWMMGLPEGWVTDPTIGISRNAQLKALGNGVVPQQAIAALTDMLHAFNQKDIAA